MKRGQEGERGRTLGIPFVSGVYKDGLASSIRLLLYLSLYLTYFSLFIAILKDLRSLALYINNSSYRYRL